MTESIPMLRRFDDDTLMDMYDHAHHLGDEHCDAIAAELAWRGIQVTPCGMVHSGRDARASLANLMVGVANV